jgi:hypothetical protein
MHIGDANAQIEKGTLPLALLGYICMYTGCQVHTHGFDVHAHIPCACTPIGM